MSTAGKVLVVLVALAIIPYLFLYSLVYQLNTNWGKEIQKLDKDIATAGEQADEAIAQMQKIRLEATQSQEQRLRDMVNLRNEVSKLEKHQTQTVEQQERIRLLLQTTKTSIDLATQDQK